MQVVLIVAAVLAVLFLKGVYDKYKYNKKLEYEAVHGYGKRPLKQITPARSEAIPYFYRHQPMSDCTIDDITWEDTDMARIYASINNCKCAIGEEYLYKLLRNPVSDMDELAERERLISHFMKNSEKRTALSKLLLKIGNLKNISAYEYISKLKDAKTDSSLFSILQALLLLAAIALIFFNPVTGIMLTLVMFFTNVITYFKKKALVSGYFTIVFFILRLLQQANELRKTEDEELKVYFDRIIDASKSFKKLKRNSFFIMEGSGAGPLELLFDYFKMAFHIDLIKFNSMVKDFSNHAEDFDIIFETIGYLDCMISVASYRKYHEDEYSVPVLSKEKKYIKARGLAHPLLEDPVTNDLETEGAVLLTGSNASGKSTFLKTVALNAILAQSIHTVLAEYYEASLFKVMTSIALRDDIESGESYYIVEIKSLKRIIEATEKNGVPVLCFIDEVLRGTNTVERIAASTQILLGLSKANAICMAATHDIELTYLLENDYSNYHFEEQIEDGEIRFDYTLRNGRATTRNAINLLRIMGYSADTVDAAMRMAERYVESGEWELKGEQ